MTRPFTRRRGQPAPTRSGLDFQTATALNQPDFRTISEFRRPHFTALDSCLCRCRRAGLAGLRHVTVDVTKLQANASEHKAMNCDRMVKAEAELSAGVANWLKHAAEADAAKDAAQGQTDAATNSAS